MPLDTHTAAFWTWLLGCLKVCLKTTFSFSSLNLFYLRFPSSQLVEILSLQLILRECLVPLLACLGHSLPPYHSPLFGKGITPSWPEYLLQLPSWSSYQTFLPRDDSQTRTTFLEGFSDLIISLPNAGPPKPPIPLHRMPSPECS